MRLRLEETLQSWRRCGVSTLVTGKQGLRPWPMVPQGWGASAPLTLCVKPAYASKAVWHPVVGLGLNGAPWLHPGRLLLGMPRMSSMVMPRALLGLPETRLSGSVGVPGTLSGRGSMLPKNLSLLAKAMMLKNTSGRPVSSRYAPVVARMRTLLWGGDALELSTTQFTSPTGAGGPVCRKRPKRADSGESRTERSMPFSSWKKWANSHAGGLFC